MEHGRNEHNIVYWKPHCTKESYSQSQNATKIRARRASKLPDHIARKLLKMREESREQCSANDSRAAAMEAELKVERSERIKLELRLQEATDHWQSLEEKSVGGRQTIEKLEAKIKRAEESAAARLAVASEKLEANKAISMSKIKTTKRISDQFHVYKSFANEQRLKDQREIGELKNQHQLLVSKARLLEDGRLEEENKVATLQQLLQQKDRTIQLLTSPNPADVYLV